MDSHRRSQLKTHCPCPYRLIRTPPAGFRTYCRRLGFHPLIAQARDALHAPRIVSGWCIVFFIIALVSCAPAATPTVPPLPTVTPAPTLDDTGRYAENGVSFVMPTGWQPYSAFWPNYSYRKNPTYGAQDVVIVADPATGGGAVKFTVSLHVMQRTLSASETMEDIVQALYAQIAPDAHVALAAWPEPIAGQPAWTSGRYDYPWGDGWHAAEDVWIEADGTLYIVALMSSPARFEAAREPLLGVLASLALP